MNETTTTTQFAIEWRGAPGDDWSFALSWAAEEHARTFLERRREIAPEESCSPTLFGCPGSRKAAPTLAGHAVAEYWRERRKAR